MRSRTLWLCGLFSNLLATALLANNSQLPIVDLGYELHQALLYNDTFDFYKFSNIRYAQPPVGDLRFRGPVAPQIDRSTVQTGNATIMCPSAAPAWQLKSFGPIFKYILGAPYTLQNWEADIANATIPDVDFSEFSTEDCLFLDVYVSPKVLNRASDQRAGSSSGAAVLVWIYGGGFVLGSKIGPSGPSQNPAGLMKYGNMEDDEGMIYVALNYRLGAFGFLSGDAVEKNGDVNTGLLDQRFALEWVQQNIHLFGGDASKVTVMGESAGGGSILLQMMDSLDNDTRLFSQAITQSPATMPSFTIPTDAYSGFLSNLNATSLEEVRKLPSAELIKANSKIVFNSSIPSYLFNPVFDKELVQVPPKQRFDSGTIPKSIRVLTGLNSFEGSFFFDPTVHDDTGYMQWLSNLLPRVGQDLLDYAANSLYPPIFDGSLGYVDYATRQTTTWAESVFHCNAELLNDYFGNNSFAYEFSVTPGIHVQDLEYTFTDDTLPGPLPAPAAQYTLQRAIASFVVHGTPYLYAESNTTSREAFPPWSPATRQAINITSEGGSLGVRHFGQNNTRCQFWQQGLYQMSQ